MCHRKKQNITYVKLSDNAVEFIKTVVLPELKINKPLTTNEICMIEDWIYDLEETQFDEEGNKIHLEKEAIETLQKAQDLLSEFMSIWGGNDGKNDTVEDLDDLNKRLGL